MLSRIQMFAATTAFLTATCLAAGAALSDSPHFIKGPSASLDADGDYVVSFKEAGLGSTPVTYSLTADAVDFTWQCFTKSNNAPQGAPNHVSFSNDQARTTITPHNGQITGSISLTPTADGASCQGGGLKLCLVAVDYGTVAAGGHVHFEDETNSIGPFTLPALAATFAAPGINCTSK
jgi:hypothetical protein